MCSPGTQGVEAKDAAKHPTVTRPDPTPKNDLVQMLRVLSLGSLALWRS